MKKITTYFTLLISLWFISGAEKAGAQCSASFNYTMNSNGNVSFMANCVPTSSATQYYWTFGNSTTYTTTGNPAASTTYTANGNYTITLFFNTIPTCSNSITYTVNISNVTCSLTSGYNYTLGSGGQVTFNSTSTGTTAGTSYTWAFGDSSPNGTGNSVSHTYNNNGVYNATLTAVNNSATCLSSIVHTVGISNALNCTLNASFTYTQGTNGQVSFSSTSTGTTGLTTYAWHYGDATMGSGAISSHTYAANNLYNVYLTLTDGACVDSSSFTPITVNSVACGLTAGYNYTGGANGQVNFSSTSTGTIAPTNYIWQFGDATANGSGVNNLHTYNTNGVYTATLTTVNNSVTCLSSIAHTFTITNALNCTINSNFTYTVSANGVVNFASTSTGTSGTTSYAWQYGDANTGSGATSAHTYTANNWYQVHLILTDGSCSDTSSLFILVNTAPCVLNASFTYTQGTNGFVHFASTSTGTTSTSSYNWYFGDAATGTGNSPSHTYTTAGTYVATLTVNNGTISAGCTSTVTQTIIISTTPCSLTANYTHTVGTGGNVNFASTSVGTSSTTTYNWNFGDGYTSTSQTPNHTYASAGAYNVSLMVINGLCVDTIVQSVNVTGIACIANSGFSMTPTATPQVWNATPNSPWNIVAANWSWGDNSSGNTLYTSHTYSASGTYSICLSVTVSCGNTSSTCVSSFIYRTSTAESLQMIQINVVQPTSIATGINYTKVEPDYFSLSPNPNNGQFELKLNGLENQTSTIKIFNLVGQTIYETEIANDITIKNINIDNVANGVYFIKISSGNKEFTKKIIVNK